MSEYAEKFIEYLMALRTRDAGAMAALRHSLAFDPGVYPKAFPYVERFVAADWSAKDARRLALYVVAGLFARNPAQREQSFAASFGEMMLARKSQSIEQRFIALLGANTDGIPNYLRQAVSLLAAADIGLDYGGLLDDVSVWMNPNLDHDRLRQRWARDFYRFAEPEDKPIAIAS